MKKLFSIVLSLLLILSLMASVNAEEYVSKSGWRVTASSTREAGGHSSATAADGNNNTYWHSDYDSSTKDEAPFYLTFYMPEETVVSGFEYVPRQDNMTGIVTMYNIYASESDTGEATLIYSGSFVGDMETKTAKFGFNVKAKTIVFEIVEGLYGYGTCAEFSLFAADGTAVKRISELSKGKTVTLGTTTEGIVEEEDESPGGKIKDKSGWIATVSSEKPAYPAKNAIDGNVKTYWHSHYEDDGTNILSREVNPHWIEVTLPEAVSISGFAYVPRTSETGRILDYEFYVSEKDSGEFELAYSGTFANDKTEKQVKFEANIKVKRVKLQSVTSGGDFGVIAELELFGENPDKPTAKDVNELIKMNEDYKLVKISADEITATATSVWSALNAASAAVDGNYGTAWHSSPDDKTSFPIALDVDLGEKKYVKQIVVYPRNSGGNLNGIWQTFNIWAGDSLNNLQKVKENISFEATADAKTVVFDEPVEARYFEFEVIKGLGGYATCAEVDFFEYGADVKKHVDSVTEYTLKIGSNEIKVNENGVVRTVTMDVAPYIDGGYTQIPLRGLLEEMGAEFTWDGEYNKITVKEDTTIIEMQIYNNIVTVTSRMYGKIRYTLRSVPQIKDSRTFVPLRFISENLGYTVTWNGDTEEITIVK